MSEHLEDALISGILALKMEARSFEETAKKVSDRDWPAARRMYRNAAECRRSAQRLNKRLYEGY